MCKRFKICAIWTTFEKRTNDLKLTSSTSNKYPQIWLIQSTNQLAALRWKDSTSVPSNGYSIVENKPSCDCVDTLKQKECGYQRQKYDQWTLRANADMLHQSAVETAKENERGVVDIETLQETQNSLIATIQETMQIQRDGRAKRAADAEQQMQVMENELKEKVVGMAEEQGRKDT